MKKLVIAWVSFMVCMSSCSNLSPKDYEEEIQDAVKYHIAMADYVIEWSQNPLFAAFSALAPNAIEEQVDKMGTAFDELYVNEDLTYKQVLERVAKDTNSNYRNDAKKILKHYGRVNISLSDYVKSSTREDNKSWKFQEFHSGIEFLFELENIDSENMTWSCSPIEKSYLKYIENGVK